MSFIFPMLKKILLGLAAIIAVFLMYIAFQSPEFTVQRSMVMHARRETVFAEVNDLRKWDAWSPWAKLDPNAKITFEGPTSGKGAIMTWSGNADIGEGSMTIVSNEPDNRIDLETKFVKPMEGTNSAQFTFEPIDQQGEDTKVTWTMNGTNNFVARIFCFLMNGKKMIGDDFEKGLAQLKSVVESK